MIEIGTNLLPAYQSRVFVKKVDMDKVETRGSVSAYSTLH